MDDLYIPVSKPIHKNYTPLIIYLILGGLILLGQLFRFKLVWFIIQAIFILFWSAIMYALCSKGHTGWAWFILFLPIIILIVLAVLVTMGVIIF